LLKKNEALITEVAVASTQTILNDRTTTYATAGNFCRIFKEEMTDLYSLALMLAADAEKAEQLFVSGLNDCASSNPVFKEWASSWARRTIIKNAVQLIAPQQVSSKRALNAAVASDAINRSLPELPAEISAVAGLNPFERFAFILSVLEGYSDQDSALLLDCTRQALIAARVRAEQQIARTVAIQEGVRSDNKPNNHESAIKLAVSMPLAMPA
jgi:DNA-directed RNA polymerase specialized sigma24 family protein